MAAMSRGRRYVRRGLLAGTWLLGLVAALMVTTIVLFYSLTDVPRPEQLSLPQVATIQYSDGSTLAKFGSIDRTIVKLEQVPKHVRWAVLAAEDRSFYGESAVSVRGTLRAAWSDLTGGSTQGGSGITQQYVKNAYLNNAQTLTRKLRELMISVKLAREYTKDQILEFYLNTVYFGRGAYGIEAAAQAFFGQHVEDLTVAQGAMLAGLLRAPSYYDPANDPGQAQQRWHYVLDGMVKTHHLSAAQEAAQRFPKTQRPRSTGLQTTGWKYLLTNAVLAELKAQGISLDDVQAKGLTIRTTIDRKAQSAALKAIDTTLAHPTKKQRNLKDALVAVDPSSGGVLAYYGGSGPGIKALDGKVDYNDWASQRANAAGSSFKPYVLATVLNQTFDQTPGKDHFAIDSLVPGDFCRKIDGTKVCNDPGDKNVSRPRVKLANALKYSLNTTFDLLALDAGPSTVAATAHKLGVAETDSDGKKTLVDRNGRTSFGIGIGDYAVTPLDQATGYATLADGGTRHDSYFVQKATSSQGDVVYQHDSHPRSVLEKKVANDVTLAMEPVAGYSAAALANGRKSAAKTGTEGIGSTTNNSDAWMAGFTPQVSAAVWIGTGTRTQPIYNSSGSAMYGADEPARIWQKFMDGYLKGTKHAKMPTRQQIDENGFTPSPTPTSHTPHPPVTRPADTPTNRPGSGSGAPSTGSGPPTTSAPPSTHSPPTGPPTTRGNPSGSKCGGLLQPPCH